MQTNQARPINETYCINDSILLGKGSTGNVYLGFERNNPYNRVAIKVIDLRTIDNQVTKYLLTCQIAALSNLGKLGNTGHQNIVRLYDIVLQDHYIFLVMEHLEGGTLADYIKRHPQGLNQNEALFIFRQILEGYAHMRNKQIVHRDLKPDNILFKGDPQKCKKVAIIDFGYCEMHQVPNKPQLYYNVGSPKYMSPQAYKQNHYSQKSDIWALGVIFYEMLAGRTCDHGMSMQIYLEMIQRQGIPLPAKISAFHRHILCTMLNYLHSSRSSADQILREIDTFLNALSHQKSQAILRTNIDVERRTLQGNINTRVNKNNAVFQSLILPSSNQGGRRSFNQNSINPWDQSQYIFQRRNTNSIGSLIPIIQISSNPIIEQSFLHQQKTAKADNINFGSVKDIIHRKTFHYGGNSTNNFFGARDIFMKTTINNVPPVIFEQNELVQQQQSSNFFQDAQPNIEVPTKIDQKPLSAIPQQLQPQGINISHPIIINNINLAKRVQFVHNFHSVKPPAPMAHPQFHTIGVPSTNGIRIKISSPSSITHIQRERKIDPDQLNQSQKYHSPQKQPVTVASSVQFFTQKKTNIPQQSQSPQKPPRPFINLRPPYVGGQIKVGFAKLQPQRPLKINQVQNQIPLVKQGFCV